MLKWYGLSAFIVVADQLTKHWVKQAFSLHEVVEITPFFNMLLVYNKGAAFSLLADAGGAILATGACRAWGIIGDSRPYDL